MPTKIPEISETMEQIPTDLGTYIIVAYCSNPSEIIVGAKGPVRLKRGYYYYVGSAFGPGGLRARLKHHLSTSPKPFWHFDYLKQGLKLESILFSTEAKPLEHQWAQYIANLQEIYVPIKRMGASDCRCPSHFFFSAKALSFNKILQVTSVKCDVLNSV